METLAKKLKKIDYFALSFGSIIGVGWLISSGDWLNRGAPLGAAITFFGCALLLIPVAISYSLLMVKFPHADAEVSYLNQIVPRKIQFIAGWSITLAYLVICPWEAIALTELLSKFLPNLNDQVLLKYTFGVIVLIIIWAINIAGISVASGFQKISVYLLLGIFFIMIFQGLSLGSSKNLQPYFTDNPMNGIIKMIQIVPYFLLGFEISARTSEESAIPPLKRGFLVPILASLIIAGLFYAAIILIASSLVPWGELKKIDYATLVAFEKTSPKNIILINSILVVTLLSLLKVLNGNFISATRMTFSISRNEFLSKSLSRLSKNTKVPTNSLLLISGLSILGIFFGRMGLITLAEIGSFAISVAWFFTSIACFIHAKQGRIVNLKLGMITGIIGSLVSFALIATKILWFIPGHLVTTHYLVLLVWLFFGLTLYFYNEKSKKAQLAQ